MNLVDLILLWSIAVVVLLPITGFIYLANRRANEQYIRLIEEHRDLWAQRALNGGKSYRQIPNKRFL